ncbi:MAG: type II toxin-antitoxin system RelE/ParE family toxin [Planctomycetes bacterium]|nr:type II toxin-antitoxin system RelE/ParE family toxin [Planctomycetota bacterium]
MSKILLRPAAADVDDAFLWYEAQEPGLGEEFLAAIEATLRAIRENPHRFPVVFRDTRRALVRRFPYAVYYRVLDDLALVIACFHARRDPKRWRKRKEARTGRQKRLPAGSSRPARSRSARTPRGDRHKAGMLVTDLRHYLDADAGRQAGFWPS